MPDMDNRSKEQRSINMSHISSKNTKLEECVGKYLFSEGFRYRKNVSNLPGKPDFVLQKYKAVIFVNGCFWHHHDSCRYATVPKSNTDFWMEKFARNTLNDNKHCEELSILGWNVITIWGCELKKGRFNDTMKRVVGELRASGELVSQK